MESDSTVAKELVSVLMETVSVSTEMVLMCSPGTMAIPSVR